MRILAFLLLFLTGFVTDSMGATRPTGRANARGTATTATTSAAKTTSARAAVNSRTAPRATSTTPQSGGVVNRGRAATTTATKPVVAARAATTQKVIGTGTKVATANKNVVVNEECQQKYYGCMDSFCMLDNDTGGRCLCSDRNAELDEILAEIEKLDQQSYNMATVGVEKIEMGDSADAVIAKANAVAQSVVDNKSEDTKKTRKSLDLSMWNTIVDFEEEDIFGSSAMSPIDGKEGDALHRAAVDLCVAQIPECASDIQMLQLMYSQQIKSDCTAYENSLKQQKNASAQKLAAAESALREAALEQFNAANKYDLGQCTVEFKKCMQTTGGCGDDFSGCANMVALDETNVRQSTSKKAKNHQIKGSVTTIEISASTYDALVSKKPLCESVTKSCVNVAAQVWDTFLREAAPQIKNAELIAEDKARQDCIGNISSCFQKACKDTMDPNDPDGSYDMCLSRPGTMLNLCKVPLNACGIDASSETAAEKSSIWDFVVARLASMRVDSCTTEVKECLQSEDRCGEDYTQCIGLDTDTIIRMCPYDKLVGCQKIYGETEIRGNEVYDELANMVQGIMLNIDNNFLLECQAAANEAMIKVCGDTENCNSLAVDENIGARSLEYKICEYGLTSDQIVISQENCFADVSQIPDEMLGRVPGSTTGKLGPVVPLTGNITGIIYWSAINVTDDGRISSTEQYIENTAHEETKTEQYKQTIMSEITSLQKNIDDIINAIESDPTVQYCMTGRQIPGIKDLKHNQNAARFPNLTKQMRMIISNNALAVARENYNKKFDQLNEQMLRDATKIAERQSEILGENKKDVYRDIARHSCVVLADLSALPKSPPPPPGIGGKLVLGIVLVAAIVVASVFTFGAAAIATSAGISAVASAASSGASFTAMGLAWGTAVTSSLATSATTAMVAGITGGAALVSGGILSVAEKYKDGDTKSSELSLSGKHEMNQWNYRETITTTFDWDNVTCQKCTESQLCVKERTPLFGKKSCAKWGEKQTVCTDVKF